MNPNPYLSMMDTSFQPEGMVDESHSYASVYEVKERFLQSINDASGKHLWIWGRPITGLSILADYVKHAVEQETHRVLTDEPVNREWMDREQSDGAVRIITFQYRSLEETFSGEELEWMKAHFTEVHIPVIWYKKVEVSS